MAKPNGKPPTDQPIPEPPPLPAVPDAPMPTVENEPGSVFRPSAGITAGDVHEIALMHLLHLINSPVVVEPGALRSIPLSAERVAQLSDSARRFMQPLIPAPTQQPLIPAPTQQ